MTKRLKTIPVAVAALTLIAAVFRVFQILVAIDYSALGFFDSETGFFACYGIYLIFVLAAAVFIVGAIYDNRNGSEAYSVSAEALTPKQTGALGVAFLAAGVFSLFDTVFGFKGFSLGTAVDIVLLVVYVAVGFLLLGRKTVSRSVGYLHLIICVCYTVKSASTFMTDTVIVKVSDELILLLSYVVSVVFFLPLGRFLSNNETKRSRKKLFVCGGMTAVLTACSSLAGYVAYLIDVNYMKEHMSNHPISQIGVLVIVFTVIFILYSGKKKDTSGLDKAEDKTDTERGSDEVPQL